MRKSESKAPLALMEQVIMVLVFALAAALCIQAFVHARNISLHMTERDHAVNIGQTLAETVKAYGGNLEEVCKELGGSVEGKKLVLYYDSEWNTVESSEDAEFRALFQPEDNDNFCQYGRVSVSETDGDREILSLKVAWQGAQSE